MSFRAGEKLFLAFFLNLYYTVEVPAGVLELVDEVDSKSGSPNPPACGISLGIPALFGSEYVAFFELPSGFALRFPRNDFGVEI